MKSYFFTSLLLCLISLSKEAHATANTSCDDQFNFENKTKDVVLNEIHKYCSKPNPVCNSTRFMKPLVDLILNQTKTGSTGYKYQTNFVKAFERFARQFTLSIISSDRDDHYLVHEAVKKFKTFASEEFSGTDVQKQINVTYEVLENGVTPEHIISLFTGESTEPLLEQYLLAIHVGFDDHPDLQTMLDLVVNLECSYSKGRSAVWTKLIQILTVSNCSSSENKDECKENVKYFNYSKDDKGCPAGFTLIIGVCYKVNATHALSYDAARRVTSDPYKSRLAKIRNQEAANFLSSQMKLFGIYHLWIGLRDVGVGQGAKGDWRWEDGTSQAFPDPNGLLKWFPSYPKYFTTNADCLMLLPLNYCWSDNYCSHSNQQLQSVLQVTATNGTCPLEFTLYGTTQTCYSIEAASGGTLAILKTYDDWKFVVGLIKNSSFDGDRFKIGGESINGKWQFDSFSQWCKEEPDGKSISSAILFDYRLESSGYKMQIHDNSRWSAFSYAKEWIASSCSEWFHLGHRTSGMYRILPRGVKVDIQVHCDMVNDGGGWTVIQSRKGQTSFQKSIADYTNGFGDIASDFWLGLEPIYQLSSQEEVLLSIRLKDNLGQHHTINYSKFRLTKNNTFCLSSDNTTAPTVLGYQFMRQQNVPFVVDPQKGGWWHTSISAVNLNGNFPTGQSGEDKSTLMQWSPNLIVTETEMKVKSTYFSKCVK